MGNLKHFKMSQAPNDREIQVAELSQQLTMAFEQIQACKRQGQLCENQIQKTNITMKEVEQCPTKMYRACGRMFVLAEAAKMKETLTEDMGKLNKEKERNAELNATFEKKKEVLTAQLNDLT